MMRRRLTPPTVRRPRHQRGLSIAELMVGLAVGLFVSTVALAAMVHQARDTRRLLLDDRLDQDLHVTAHLLARHLRRAGHWADAPRDGVSRPGGIVPPPNPHGITPGPPDQVRFTYSSPGGAAGAPAADGVVASHERFGFRLRDHMLDIELGQGRWQPLTDPSRLRITALHIEPRTQDRAFGAVCSRPCPTEGPACPPRARTLGFDVSIDATATHDPARVRRVAGHVRLRNDQLVGACPP